MSQMNQEAVYILNRRVYKESSLLLDILCPSYGRLSIIAKGALNNKKSCSAILQVFQPLLMIWAGKSSLKTLVAVEAPSEAISLQGRRLFSAYYLNELLIRLIPQDHSTSSHASLFINYAKALQDLATFEEIEIPLRVFEYQLLSDLGVLPDLILDVNGDLISSKIWYQYLPSIGFSPFDQNDRMDKAPSSTCFFGECLIKLTDLSPEMYLDKVLMRQAKYLMRSLISEQLGGHELKSRALFQTYQPFRGA